MGKDFTMILIIFLFLQAPTALTNAQEAGMRIEWHWEDDFSPGEKQKIETWLTHVTEAAGEILGTYPFTIHFFIHRRDGASEPVPWASTRRHELQGVDFHIDPTYSLQAFLNDWTAPHEISHLSIPFLGRDQSWFAEGYASFMQYQIMESLGIYSHEEVMKLYAGKIERCRSAYDRKEDFITVARELRSQNRYPDMYWGGASFFMQVDRQLRSAHGRSMNEIINGYLLCCRLEDEALSELIATWDEILGEALFSEELRRYQTVPASEILPRLQ